MIGSLMLDVQGTSLSSEEKELLKAPQVGGLILFARNYVSRAQLSNLISEIRDSSPDILIAVDQEGGRVQRLRDEFQVLPPLQKIGNLAASMPDQAADIAHTFGWLMAADVLCTGIDFSFAPVLDLDRAHCVVIADRSFSDDPTQCIELAKPYIEGMQAAGMAATAKHFPGHGGVSGDSHLELPVDERTWEEVDTHDIRPFRALADTYDAVMPGHLLFPSIDDNPVGFSPFWLQEVLRKQLGFEGVIFSDDLSMEGAAAAGTYAERASLALEAGCDMVLVCNNPTGALSVLSWMQEQPAKENLRLNKMRSRVSWDLSKMHADPRFEKSKQYLKMISEFH